MPGYADVRNARPEALATLAAAWSGVADTHTDASRLLAAKASDVLHGKSLDGQSIRAAQGRAEKLNQRIRAGVAEADDIARLVKGFGADIAGLRAELAELAAQVKEQDPYLKLDENSGEVTYTPPPMAGGYQDHPEIYAEITADGSRAATAFNERIADVLKRAGKLDAEFVRNLTMVAELDRRFDASFNPDGGGDLAARDDAERVSQLLRGGKDHKVSESELAQANQLLERHADNDVFATTLMTELGPKGLLTVSGDIAFRFGSDDDPADDRLALDAQRQLGAALATATDPDNPSHVSPEWMAELREQGATPYLVGDRDVPGGFRETSGYSVLAPMLTHGEFDTAFITPVAKHMLALDATGMDWSSPQGPDPLLGHDRVAVNPVNGVLVALDHSPEAAADFFSDKDGGERFPAYPFGSGAVEEVDDPLRYVLESANDHGSGNGVPIDADLTGNAIEAAATGMSSEPDGSTPPPRTPAMTGIAQQTMEYATAHPEQFVGVDADKAGMVDNFGGITAAYIEDFHLDKQSEHFDLLEPSAGNAHLDLDRDVTGSDHDLGDAWLKLVGHDEVGSATVWAASEQLAQAEMGKLVDLGGVEKGQQFNEIFEMHGDVTGKLTSGGLEGIRDDAFAAAEDKNAVLDGVKKGASIGAGVAIGATGWGLGTGTVAAESANVGLDALFGWARDSDDEVWEHIDADQKVLEEQIEKDHIKGPMMDRVREYVEAAAPHMSAGEVNLAVENYIERYEDAVKVDERRLTGPG